MFLFLGGGDMRKSIFSQLDGYKSDPLVEFGKITRLIYKEASIYRHTISTLFEVCFPLSESLRPYYVDYNDCIRQNTSELSEHCGCDYASLPVKERRAITEEFLKYCEILIHLYFVSFSPNGRAKWSDWGLNQAICKQFVEFVHNSLHSIGYKTVVENEEMLTCCAIKINPQAECVAEASPKTIRAAIYEYLGSRDGDVKAKETALHHLIDRLEPTLSKYHTAEMIGQIKRYSQLIRHPDTKQKEKPYLWFVKDKERHLDEMFNMCIYVESYVQTKETLNKFLVLEEKAKSSN